MAGFLDQNERIIDMVLTARGHQLLSSGQLNFVSWAAFDDEVDYAPYISTSASLTPEALLDTVLEHIENTPIRECTSGYKTGINVSGSDFTNVIRPLFDMPQGSNYLPRASGPTGSFVLSVQQQKLQTFTTKRNQHGDVFEKMGPYDQGHVRFNASTQQFVYTLPSTDYPTDYHPDGYLLKVFVSGAEGLVQVFESLDTQNNPSYQNDLILRLDGSSR